MTEFSRINLGKNRITFIHIPKVEIEKKFDVLITGVYNVKNTKLLDEIKYISAQLFNSQLLNNYSIKYYATLLIRKFQILIFD